MFVFLCSSEYEVFEIDISHICGINHGLHPYMFFQTILKLVNIYFEFFLNNRIIVPWEPKISPVVLKCVNVDARPWNIWPCRQAM
jgi:hypothetical protein